MEKKTEVKNEKINKLSPNIITDSITKLDKPNYAGSKLICDKIGVPLRNRNKKKKLR